MKLILAAVLATGVLTSINNANALIFNDHNYEFVQFAGKNWDEAANDMYAKFGSDYYLATITSQEEQQFLSEILLGESSGQYWLGASQPLAETNVTANWNWSTGEVWSYTNWQVDEPNDYYGAGSEQHLAIWKRSGWNWEWNDEGNLKNIRGYVAEAAAPVPEPATMILFGTGLVGLAAARRRKKV